MKMMKEKDDEMFFWDRIRRNNFLFFREVCSSQSFCSFCVATKGKVKVVD